MTNTISLQKVAFISYPFGFEVPEAALTEVEEAKTSEGEQIDNIE